MKLIFKSLCSCHLNFYCWRWVKISNEQLNAIHWKMLFVALVSIINNWFMTLENDILVRYDRARWRVNNPWNVAREKCSIIHTLQEAEQKQCRNFFKRILRVLRWDRGKKYRFILIISWAWSRNVWFVVGVLLMFLYSYCFKKATVVTTTSRYLHDHI